MYRHLQVALDIQKTNLMYTNNNINLTAKSCGKIGFLFNHPIQMVGNAEEILLLVWK